MSDIRYLPADRKAKGITLREIPAAAKIETFSGSMNGGPRNVHMVLSAGSEVLASASLTPEQARKVSADLEYVAKRVEHFNGDDSLADGPLPWGPAYMRDAPEPPNTGDLMEFGTGLAPLLRDVEEGMGTADTAAKIRREIRRFLSFHVQGVRP